MKKYFLLFAFLPLIVAAQKAKKSSKPVVAKKEATNVATVTSDSFHIFGTIQGYPDGTSVSLLNGNNGAPEANTQITKDKFTFTGKADYPDFKLIAVNGKAPYITLFIDNSKVIVTGNANSLESAVVTGSASHNDFMTLNNLLNPFQQVFTQEGTTDTIMKNAASLTLIAFVKQHPNSYVAPLAIYRNFQARPDGDMMNELYSGLSQQVKEGPIGRFIAQQLAEINKNPIGKPLADFSQADSTGKIISLSSLRGKYVLVDFWASWCGPCRMENPNVVAAYNKYKERNYTVLGVSFDKSKQPWVDAIRADNLTWTHVSDLKGWANAVGQQFQISQIPQNFLVDPNGILIAKNLRGAALENKLASLLGN